MQVEDAKEKQTEKQTEKGHSDTSAMRYGKLYESIIVEMYRTMTENVAKDK